MLVMLRLDALGLELDAVVLRHMLEEVNDTAAVPPLVVVLLSMEG